MESVKMFDGVLVTVDAESVTITDGGFHKVFEVLNMASPEYDACRVEVVRNLMAFGHLDLSAAYHGHTVTLDIIPCKD